MRFSAAITCLILCSASPIFAQQRPLVTEDPETIGAGRILIEGGFDYADDVTYTTSGLSGNLWRIPTIGVSFGISSIAELQIDGGLHDSLSITGRNPNAPLANLLTSTDDTTHDVEDTIIGIKIRMLAETPTRPAFAVRFAAKMGNASVNTGLGTHTNDFFGSILVAKTIQSVRVVGNLGAGTLTDPMVGHSQNDVLTYGLSFARAVTQATEVVGEVNGRVSFRDPVIIGTETRGLMKFGGRYTFGAWRLDGGIYFGLTAIDPTIGFTTGFTYVFNAFTLP